MTNLYICSSTGGSIGDIVKGDTVKGDTVKGDTVKGVQKTCG